MADRDTNIIIYIERETKTRTDIQSDRQTDTDKKAYSEKQRTTFNTT